MLIKVSVPVTNQALGLARIDSIDVEVGQQLRSGARLVDFTLGADIVQTHDCPPVTTYRVTSRERGWVRRIDAAPDDMVEQGAAVMLVSSEPDEPLDGAESRSARVSVAAILAPLDW
ncbi:MAG: hypothetical protein H6917_04360 [Novosphingobium sp.]|nr:hypothetical protein [Novosphingobium sp.]MCP5401607.1 hypothetical protein [Novosphingobium sp.]